jgi:hypothetical protein
MPPNAGRENSKIVAPLTPNREQELIGGLKNALDRGETLEKAKQSFLNAGYKQNEINAAVQKMPAANSQIVKPVAIQEKQKIPASQPRAKQEVKPIAQPSTTTTATPSAQPKQVSKGFMIILISLAILVLIGAAFLGLFWDRLF